MTAPILTIADAVVTALNAADLSQSFTATRVYVPKFDLESADLQVLVVPKVDAREMGTAGSDRMDATIDIGVYKRLSGTIAAEPGEVDALMDLCEEIRAVVNRQRLTGAEDAVCMAIVQDPLYSVEHLDEKRIFLTVLSATFVEHVEVS